MVGMGEATQEDESGLLTIHNATRAHAGLYQCTVNNGIAPPATADVQLVVQCETVVLLLARTTRTKHTHLFVATYTCFCSIWKIHEFFYSCVLFGSCMNNFNVYLVFVVKPELQKGAQWRKVGSRGDGTTTAKVVCQAEGIPRVEFSWEKNGVPMDFANPRWARRCSPRFLAILWTVNLSATVSTDLNIDESLQLD